MNEAEDIMSLTSKACPKKRTSEVQPSMPVFKKQKRNMERQNIVNRSVTTKMSPVIRSNRGTKHNDSTSEMVLEGDKYRRGKTLAQWQYQHSPKAKKHKYVPSATKISDTVKEEAVPVLSGYESCLSAKRLAHWKDQHSPKAEKHNYVPIATKISDTVKEEAVPVLSAELAPGCLGTQKTVSILDNIKQEGRDSSKVKAFLDSILLSCKKHFNENDNVWVAYEPGKKDVPVFVAEVERRINDAPEHVNGCRLVQLVEEAEVASAARGYDDNENNKKLNFSGKERIELRKCMDRNTDKLLKSHSNILAIIGSDKILHDKRKKIEDRTCVVIYVRTKRFIPFYEEQFTLDNNDCPLDVREGRSIALVSRLNPKEYTKALRVHCRIECEYGCGTLAGFVELPDGKIACLTAWHIFDTREGDHTAELLKSEKFKKNVYQPCRSEDHDYEIGRVTEVRKDFDAALIEIEKPERLPRNGHFPNAVCPEKGFPPSTPMKFESGNIINSLEDCDSRQSCRVVKYGAETETTFGNIGPLCDAFQIALTNNRRYVVKSPICVCTQLGKTFSAKGDSGSLVFLEDDETKELRALGMIVGKMVTDNNFTVVVPIWEILQSFNLPLRLLSFEEPYNIVLDALQAHMKEVDKKLDKINNVTKKSNKTLT